MSVEMPVEIITTEIVNAARRTRKPKTVVEVSIVDEILANVRENKFAEEACETLKRIFGREFCVEKGIEPSVNDPEPVVEPKAKKPRAKKATTSEATTSEASEAPKVKKPRAKKATASEATTSEATTSEATTSEATTSEATTSEAVEAPKVKKPRAKKSPAVEATTSEPVEATTSEPVEAPKEKKPRAKKATTSEEKKPRAKKTETVITMGEVNEPVVEPVVNTPILVTEPVVVENLGDGFSEHWSDELVEEELSDIEEEEE